MHDACRQIVGTVIASLAGAIAASQSTFVKRVALAVSSNTTRDTDQSLPKSFMNLEFVASRRGVLRAQCCVAACGKAVVEDPTPVEGFALTRSDLLLCCWPASASQTAGTTPVSWSEAVEVFTIVSIWRQDRIMPPPVASSCCWSAFMGTPRRREFVPYPNGWKEYASLQQPRRPDTRRLRCDGRRAS